jgi:hypothetical protein
MRSRQVAEKSTNRPLAGQRARLSGASERARIFKQEMESVFPGAVISDEMGSLTQGMSGRDLRHLASQVRTLAYPGAPSREQYLEAVKSSRMAHNTRFDSEARWETLVLDAGALERLKLTCLLEGPAGSGQDRDWPHSCE